MPMSTEGAEIGKRYDIQSGRVTIMASTLPEFNVRASVEPCAGYLVSQQKRNCERLAVPSKGVTPSFT
jgi:hypothetical protein